MEKHIYILVVEDELEVMDALVNDLQSFENYFPIETANSSEEAKEVVEQIQAEGSELGLILCDHVLPGQNGVDFLVEQYSESIKTKTKKVLVTGQAGFEDTILALNNADLDHYIAKPWTKQELDSVVIKLLTDYVIEQKHNPMKYMAVLDAVRLADYMREHKLSDY